MTCASIKVVNGAYLHCAGDDGHEDNHRFAVEWTTSEQYVPPPPRPTVEEQIERLRSKYPDLQVLPSEVKEYGGFTVRYSIDLPKGKFNTDRTWVAFDVPPGFPAARPENFCTDPELRLSYGGFIRNTSHGVHPRLGEAKRKWKGVEYSWDVNVQVVHGRVQMWSPNHDTLFTYAMVIKHALEGGWLAR
jgi:Prokaryotic E2 family E